MMKRLPDMLIAVPNLILVSPVMLISAILIRLDSPGPVFFTLRHNRSEESHSQLLVR